MKLTKKIKTYLFKIKVLIHLFIKIVHIKIRNKELKNKFVEEK